MDFIMHDPDDVYRRVRRGRNPAGAAHCRADGCGADPALAAKGALLLDSSPGDACVLRHGAAAESRYSRAGKVFGAMGYTIGKFGIGAILSLGQLLACVYLTSAVFVFVVLGAIARAYGFSLWKVLRYQGGVADRAFGTSSSETALLRLMETRRRLAALSTVGIVLPAGYSFNLDGTCIYLTMAALFIAQATNTPLTLAEQLGLLGVLLLTEGMRVGGRRC